MSIIGKIMGIAQKNNAQLYEHNGLTPNYTNAIMKAVDESCRTLTIVWAPHHVTSYL